MPNKKHFTGKIARAAASLLLAGGAFAMVPLLAEFAAMIQNHIHGAAPRPFLVDGKLLKDPNYGVHQVGNNPLAIMSFLDPHLGYAHDTAKSNTLSPDGAIPGFVLFGQETDQTVLRVAALGGSTTDPLDEANWPKAFAEICEEQGISTCVYNGGVSGYSSNQELLKLLRDVLPLRPDLVVSLSGINDLGFIHSMPEHPMVHPYQG